MLRNKHIYYKLTIGQSLGMDTYTNKLQTVTGRPQYGWQTEKHMTVLSLYMSSLVYRHPQLKRTLLGVILLPTYLV